MKEEITLNKNEIEHITKFMRENPIYCPFCEELLIKLEKFLKQKTGDEDAKTTRKN